MIGRRGEWERGRGEEWGIRKLGEVCNFAVNPSSI
jgi:hypothetical protein